MMLIRAIGSSLLAVASMTIRWIAADLLRSKGKHMRSTTIEKMCQAASVLDREKFDALAEDLFDELAASTTRMSAAIHNSYCPKCLEKQLIIDDLRIVDPD